MLSREGMLSIVLLMESGHGKESVMGSVTFALLVGVTVFTLAIVRFTGYPCPHRRRVDTKILLAYLVVLTAVYVII
jgi:hypothetical protein